MCRGSLRLRRRPSENSRARKRGRPFSDGKTPNKNFQKYLEFLKEDSITILILHKPKKWMKFRRWERYWKYVS
ncbi:hypothetical protein LEP1GSC034_2125 [Leptospira interrogans str. 2003000735]|uniref:Uncharacterized protein n=1 Tax=Leptospira interrogans serovar Australis str. 200703203 TaxID=1085541 RepID=N1UUG2_LEPIR|nr:hypothetical protein LEP1GSC033_4277 [Leptospira interrogans str. 2002000632]EMJ75792.1 hypothetical protein LEP1GSC034_2125 [Leptospira interrogans str. 2003000735]EMY27276.1 hypothetical protein LEP1GSC115_3914 [Leptospira interrogans serovar Australis str. 200703203]OOB98739.1 hypothetical protein B0192_09545 [Leptospira interrogans serovar Australis]